jgi:hypothetical protein
MLVEELPFGGKNSSKSGQNSHRGTLQERLITALKIGLAGAHILKILVIIYVPIWLNLHKINQGTMDHCK